MGPKKFPRPDALALSDLDDQAHFEASSKCRKVTIKVR